ncbi:hypothetical protein FHX16_006426 [Rhizobium sp. BK661]|nr:hypothetical protein [Rhizobium sp. BK661]
MGAQEDLCAILLKLLDFDHLENAGFLIRPIMEVVWGRAISK